MAKTASEAKYLEYLGSQQIHPTLQFAPWPLEPGLQKDKVVPLGVQLLDNDKPPVSQIFS